MVPEPSSIEIQGIGSGIGGVSMNSELARMRISCQGLLQRYIHSYISYRYTLYWVYSLYVLDKYA